MRNIQIIQNVKGSVNITKEEVMRITGCPASEDGDSSAWYGYVLDAIQDPQCKFTIEPEKSDTVLDNTRQHFACVKNLEW